MLRRSPLYQLYLQNLRHHRQKITQTQLQQVSDVKGWSLIIVLQWTSCSSGSRPSDRGGGGGHLDPDIRGVVSVWSNNIGGALPWIRH